jgi:hypothetical protein
VVGRFGPEHGRACRRDERRYRMPPVRAAGGTARVARAAPAVLALVAVLTLTGCASLAGLRVPTAAFQRVQLVAAQPDLTQAALRLDMAVVFRFTNPLSRDLTVPAHEFRLILDEQQPLDFRRQAAFDLPAASVVDISYPFELDLRPDGPLNGLTLLGRDVPYEFVSIAELRLPFSLGSHELQFSHRGAVRLPLLPVVSPASALPSMALIGTFQTIDLGAVRDTMAPFVDLLFNGTVPGVLGEQSVMDAIIATLELVNDDAGELWDEFTEAWDDFRDAPIEVLVPSALPDGVRVEVPFTVYNPNYFAIDAPQLWMGASLAGSPVRLSYVGAGSDGDTRIPERSSRTMRFVTELRWGEIQGGLAALVSGARVNVNLAGEATVDVGYGPTRVPVALSVPLDLVP